jgi:hypothetical protein
MPVADLQIDRAAETRLRAIIAREFRQVATRYGSEKAAAESLGMSRQRFKKYLDKKMTPKADVLLVAMAKWNLKIVHEGIGFSADVRPKKVRSVPTEQLTLDYFDEPQILRDTQRNIEVKVSRKQTDTLRFAVEVRLAG